MAFDIFISYKRKSLATANNLYYRLTTRGYSTFYDLEEMGRDNFNTQILEYIDNAKDVFVILEEGSLDACKDGTWQQDWFCREIAYAIKKEKNIIPILLGGYKMPDESFFPNEMKPLRLKQGPEFSFSFFGTYIDRLIEKKFLISVPNKQDKATSVFKFYSNENCQVFKDGKLVCSLDGMSDEPYYLPVNRKGDYRFKAINDSTGKTKIIDENIDAVEEKNVQITWKHKLNIKQLFINNRKGRIASFCVLALLAIVFIPFIIEKNHFGHSTLTDTSTPVDTAEVQDTICTPVNLGLPSGTLWGDRNVGAKRYTDFGNLYAWGEITPKNPYTLSLRSYLKRITTAENDAATAILGPEWSIPTAEQFNELLSSCRWVWKKINGHYGFQVIGKNGNSIFLPAAGRNPEGEIEFQNQFGYYWTCERSTPLLSRGLSFPKKGKGNVEDGYSTYGRSIRAVYDNEAVCD